MKKILFSLLVGSQMLVAAQADVDSQITMVEMPSQEYVQAAFAHAGLTGPKIELIIGKLVGKRIADGVFIDISDAVYAHCDNNGLSLDHGKIINNLLTALVQDPLILQELQEKQIP